MAITTQKTFTKKLEEAANHYGAIAVANIIRTFGAKNIESITLTIEVKDEITFNENTIEVELF